jgi:CheY-like chemotaxis protein
VSRPRKQRKASRFKTRETADLFLALIIRLQRAKKSAALSGVPVAIMSSAAEPRGHSQAKELGVDRYITKPPNLEDFLQIGHVLKEMLLQSRVAQARRDCA